MKRSVVSAALLALGLVWCVPSWAAEAAGEEQPGGVKSLEERVAQLEEALGRKVESGKWYDRVQVSGLVEVEAGYAEVDFDDPALEDEDRSDVDLATVELAVDARIHANVDGHVRFKYEEDGDDDGDDLFVDEGFIALNGGGWNDGYLIAGKQYVPFGNFDTHFITDPNTLILGETNDGAAVVGYRFLEDKLNTAVGVFNGDVREAGDDDHVDSYVAAVKAKPFESLGLGISYSSNLAGSDSFNDTVVDADKEIDSLVDAWSAFFTFRFLERYTLIGEYVGGLDEFRAGEIYAADDAEARKPSAWNTELSVALLENLELAVRYGGAEDGGADFLPEKQYGAVVNWGFFTSTNLALEYLRGEFEEDYQTTDSFLAQLAVAF